MASWNQLKPSGYGAAKKMVKRDPHVSELEMFHLKGGRAR